MDIVAKIHLQKNERSIRSDSFIKLLTKKKLSKKGKKSSKSLAKETSFKKFN